MERLKIYLCAQYARIYELQDYRDDLESRGYQCTSVWLGGHSPEEDLENTANPELADKYWPTFGEQDMMDVGRADLLIAFTEAPGEGPPRGGRHWEAGFAIGRGKLVIVVGPKENVFYHLPTKYGVSKVDCWEEAMELVDKIALGRERTGRVEFPKAENKAA